MNVLKNLNPQQKQAVTAGNGPVLVMAGPGSGKTRVLTQRIAYLIGSMGVQPYQIIAVTFTNKAAREMEQRVVEMIGENTRGLLLGTFHATCARILRREAEHLPFESNFVIFDSDDQISLVKRAVKDLDLDEKRFRPPSVHAAISNAKNELILPEEFPVENYRDEVVKRIYKRYSDLLLLNNALDFDDLLLWTAFLLEENQVVRQKYAKRFEHVLVDEFQDTNLAQYVLLRHLASHHNNIFVVGDTDQSIYRWRGADYRNVLRFERDFPDTLVILLEQNYRSTQAILDVAMAIIDRNPYRTPKRLFTERPSGNKAVLEEVSDDRFEAVYIVETVADLVATGGRNPGEFAIMYRTNAQSRVIEEAFLKANLPYKLVGAQRFYGRREVKDIIAYLRVIHNPNDELSLTRIINTPTRGIGDKTGLALRTVSQREGISPGVLLLNLDKADNNPGDNNMLKESLPARSYSALLNFATLLSKWINTKSQMTPLGLVDSILTDVDYRAYIDDGTDEGQDRWDNVMELRRLAAEYQEQGIEMFLEQIALVSDQDTLDTTTNVPTLLTLHAAKGLEFPIVFITGLNDGTLPHSRSFDDPEAMMEERRLLYVGITRAMDSLYLLYSQSRISYGFKEAVSPSRFLSDIPFELLRTSTLHRQVPSGKVPSGKVPSGKLPSGKVSTETFSKRWQETEEKGEIEQRYHPGMRVQHSVWGEGMVLNTRRQDDDEIIDIFFEDVGLKRVAASLAKLEIISGA